MNDSNSRLGPWLERFLIEHIVTERNLSRNTQKSYRDTFMLLLPFVRRRLGKSVDRLSLRDLTSELVLEFLAHLEDVRGCSAQTRNLRLNTIRAFARFVGSRDPALVGWCGHIRAIPSKKAMPQPITWLSKNEVDALLKVPNRKTTLGRTEHALLLFLYNTGGARLRSYATPSRRLAVWSRRWPPCACHASRKGPEDSPMPLDARD